jgi:DNA polymerase-1
VGPQADHGVKELGNPTVRLVDDVQSAGEFLTWLGERRPILAIDTETTGLKWWTPNFLRLVQFGDGKSGWAISARNWRGVIERALQAVRDDGVPTGWWNPKFDYHALESAGLPTPDPRRAHDGYTMHHLLHSDHLHGLKGVAERDFGDIASVGDRMLKLEFARTGTDWATIPDDNPAYWAYGAVDTIITALELEEMWPQVATLYRPQYEREMASMWVMYGCESRGMRVDSTYAGLIRDDWMERAAVLAEGLVADGIENPNSNKQITDALERAGWAPEEYTDKGHIKLDKAILASLEREFPGDVAPRILEFRRLLKWSNTYLRPFAEAEGGVVHPDIRNMGAKTGRQSAANPPLHQLPSKGEGGKLIRRAVLPRHDGDVLYATDYDGQELRLHAHYSGSAAMIKAFRDGTDPHTFTASLAYGVPMEQVTKALRDPAKNTRYSKLYGAGNAKIALTAGVPVATIDDFVVKMDAMFPEEKRFAEKLERVAKERWADEGQPYVTTWGGRRVYGDGDKLYALLNYLIQGSCADILKDRLVALHAAGLSEHIVVPVHDEVLWSFPADDAAEMAQTAAGIMTLDKTFAVPLTVGIDGPLDNWGAKY